MFRKYFIVTYNWQDRDNKDSGYGACTVSTPFRGYPNLNELGTQQFPDRPMIAIVPITIHKISMRENRLYNLGSVAQNKRINVTEKTNS